MSLIHSHSSQNNIISRPAVEQSTRDERDITLSFSRLKRCIGKSDVEQRDDRKCRYCGWLRVRLALCVDFVPTHDQSDQSESVSSSTASTDNSKRCTALSPLGRQCS